MLVLRDITCWSPHHDGVVVVCNHQLEGGEGRVGGVWLGKVAGPLFLGGDDFSLPPLVVNIGQAPPGGEVGDRGDRGVAVVDPRLGVEVEGGDRLVPGDLGVPQPDGRG